jgi:outer membrane protein TolC
MKPRTARLAAVVAATGIAWAAAAPARGETTAAAPPAAPPSMTLVDALAYARAHQPLIRSALARFAARRSEARIPRASWLPQVGATAQLLYGTTNNTTASYLNVPEVDLPRIGGTLPSGTGGSMSPSASSLAAVTLDQEVYDFGKISALIAAADALVEEAHADTDLVRLDVDLSVEEAFDSVLAAKEVLAAAEDAWRRADEHRRFAQAGVRSGLRPPVDLTRADAELAQADVRRIRARTGLVTARSALAASLASNALEIDAVAPAPSESAAGSPGLAQALALAERKNPALLAGLARIRAQGETAKAIGRELLPNLFASGTLSARAGGASPSSNSSIVPFGEGWLPDVVNWHVGVVLQWNVFDATVLARRDAARAREEQARADLESARTNVALAVERAYIDLQAAQQVIPGLVTAVASAQANLAQADARYRAGLGTVIELTDAETLLTNAQVQLAIGRFAADRARAELGRAIGASAAPQDKR